MNLQKAFSVVFPMRKRRVAAVALLSALFFVGIFASLQTANASTPPIKVPTYAYLAISPDPVGINQPVFLIMWLHGAPPTAAGIGGDRWRDFTIDVTKPDGTTEKLGPFTSDPTGSTFTQYTPSQLGMYTFVFSYPGQVLSLNNPQNGLPGQNSPYINDTFLPSNTTVTLTVQQTPVAPVEEYPLPTEYWTRPIEGQNTAWASIASHWLGGAQIGGRVNLWQKDGLAPNSPHIMWAKSIEFGGVVGGSSDIPGVGFYSGGAYEGRFSSSMIIAGKLYYYKPLNHASGDRTSASEYVCVDLRTGEEQWVSQDVGIIGVQTYSSAVRPTMKGQLFDYESMNQHGVVGGVLWEVVGTTWIAWDGFTGEWLYNLTNVPAGFEVYTNKGEIVRYVLNYNSTLRSGWMALWNNTQDNVGLHLAIGTTTDAYQWRPIGKSVDMSTAYSWNVTIPSLPGSSNPAIVGVIPGDIILGRSSTFGRLGTPDPYTMWAISDKPTTRGQLLWIKNYSAPAGNVSRTTGPIDTVNRLFLMTDAETMEWIGYNLDTGEQSWGPLTEAERAFSYYGSGLGGQQIGFTAYGNLYVQGYGGELICYSAKNGSMVWKYNNTNSGLDTPWGLRPIFVAAIADGKVYAFNNEHSPNTPLYKGQKVYCIDAFTGEELWTMQSWAGQVGGAGDSTSVLAEGFLAYYNYYDGRIYCVGKGPVDLSVSVSPKTVPQGSSVLIEGTVADICAGAEQLVDDGKFDFVPAMSDESMASWMEYLYMQKPIPGNATGVPVKLTAVDADGNSVDLGTVISDLMGKFVFKWNPPTTGTYTVFATFEGTDSYWPSSDEAFVGVDAPTAPAATTTPASMPTAPATPTASPTVSPTVAPQPTGGIPTETLLIAAAAAVIIIAVVVAAAILRRR